MAKKIKKINKDDWAAKLKKHTGQAIDGNDFYIADEILYEALGPYWGQVLKKAIEVGAKNILAITSKSLRKTAIVKFIQHYLLSRHAWLQAMDLRRTKEQSSSGLMQAHLDALKYWAMEYNVPWLRETIQQASFKMYFIRDKGRKDNQEISFSSFEAMKKVGGFTHPYVFHWEELVDPDSKGQAPTKEEFMYVYDLVDQKNQENFLAAGQELNKFPTHFFTMNRWDTEHPLIEFAEEHAPWEQVKEWMLEDPENNNFFMHYVEETNEGWGDLDKTLIIYGSKLANHLLVKNEEWKQKQLKLIETRDPQKLGTVLGDVFEGTSNSLNAYHYTKTTTITRDEFKEDYAKHVNKVYVSIDLDFSRQIRIRPKYSASKVVMGDGVPVKVRRLIREKAYAIKCDGVSVDGAKTELYLKQTVRKLELIWKQIREDMPHIRRMYLLFDDNQAQWVGRFNFGDIRNPFWHANKVDFSKQWKIVNRPKDMDEAQDTGFIVDIEDPTNVNLHSYLKKVVIDESNKKSKTRQRLEKDRDMMVDDMNSDEYPLYLERGNLLLNNKATRMLGGKNEWGKE